MGLSNQPRTLLTLTLFSLALLFGATQSNASYVLDEPIVGGHILVAEDGYVTAQFVGSHAGYFNSLYLETPTDGSIFLFNKSSQHYGAPLVLGWFEANTELTFRLAVRNTGYDFYTGSGDLNVDGFAHAMAITQLTGDGGYLTTVGFEDLYGGGDRDYDDFVFRLTNVIDPPTLPAAAPVPVPSALALMGLGLAGIGLGRRRRS
jgi:hypothetical protein